MRPNTKTNWHEAARSHPVVGAGQFPPYLVAVRNKGLLTSHPTERGLHLPIARRKASLSDKGSDANEALEGLRWRRVVLRRCAGSRVDLDQRLALQRGPGSNRGLAEG
jgi:hypothetical protein